MLVIGQIQCLDRLARQTGHFLQQGARASHHSKRVAATGHADATQACLDDGMRCGSDGAAFQAQRGSDDLGLFKNFGQGEIDAPPPLGVQWVIAGQRRHQLLFAGEKIGHQSL